MPDPGARTLRVRALIGMSFTMTLSARPVDALALLDQAENIAGDRGDLRSIVHRQRGVVLANIGRVRDSLHEFDLAARDEGALTDMDVILLLMNRALSHAHLGHAAQAAADTDRLLDLADPERFPVERFMGTYNAGMIAYLAGDLPGALETMHRADTMAVEVPRAPGRLDHATVLLDAGLAADAIRVADSAVTEAAAHGQRLFVAQLHTLRSRAFLLLGRPADAYAAASAALAQLPRGKGAVEPRAAAQLTALSAQLDRGDAPRPIARRAEAILTQALESGSANVLAAQLVAAEAWLGIDPARAQAVIEGWQTELVVSLSNRLRLRHVKATSAIARGDQPTARRVLRAAAADLRAGQRTVASLDIGAARALHTVPLVTLDIELALRSGPAALFAATERWRIATAPMAAVRPPADDETAAMVARLRAAHAQLAEAPPDAAPGLRAGIRDLERAVRMRDWSSRPSASSLAPEHQITMSQARERLAADGSVAVSLFTHDGVIHALVIGDGRPRIEAGMPAARAEELGRRVMADLRMVTTTAAARRLGSVRAALAAELAELDAGLLGTLRIGDRPLLILPTRYVSGLPWALLPRLAGVPVLVAGSVTAALTPAPPAPARPAVQILTGPGLGTGEREAEAVAGAWRSRGDVHVDSNASGAALRRALGSGTHVHISAHGRHEDQSPLFSRLDLADGPIFAYDLQDGGIAARSIVLSACEIGGSTRGPGEGSIGFANTLLALGACSVVAAATPVPDDLATDVAGHLHRGLAAGATVDVALASAIAASGHDAGVFGAFGRRC